MDLRCRTNRYRFPKIIRKIISIRSHQMVKISVSKPYRFFESIRPSLSKY